MQKRFEDLRWSLGYFYVKIRQHKYKIGHHLQFIWSHKIASAKTIWTFGNPDQHFWCRSLNLKITQPIFFTQRNETYSEYGDPWSGKDENHEWCRFPILPVNIQVYNYFLIDFNKGYYEQGNFQEDKLNRFIVLLL